MSGESAVNLDTELYEGPHWKTVIMLDARTHTKTVILRCSAVPIEFLSEVGT